MNQSVSALIVDDHQLYRDGLSSLLEKNSFVKQVFQAENGLEAVFQMRRNPLPLIFMDLKMPVMDGYEAIKIIHKEFPKTTILVLSDFLQPYLIHELDTIGADGYLTKGTSNHELSEAINWMFSGGVGQKPYLSKEVKEMQKNEPVRNDYLFPHPNNKQNEKEKTVLHLLLEENTNKEIGDKMGLPINRLKNINHLYMPSLGPGN